MWAVWFNRRDADTLQAEITDVSNPAQFVSPGISLGAAEEGKPWSFSSANSSRRVAHNEEAAKAVNPASGEIQPLPGLWRGWELSPQTLLEIIYGFLTAIYCSAQSYLFPAHTGLIQFVAADKQRRGKVHSSICRILSPTKSMEKQ